MNDIKYYEIHKNCKRKYLAKGKNYITFDNTWSIKNTDIPILYAIKDFKECLLKSFEISLGENTEKFISFSINPQIENYFSISVSEKMVEFTAKDTFSLVQAIYYAEDLMKLFGDASLEIKEYNIDIKVKNRIATSSLENGNFTKEYVNILLHFGYNGAILYYHDEESLKNLREYGLKAYLYSDEKEYFAFYDGVIGEKGDIATLENVENKIEYIKNLDKKAVIISFDEGQAIKRDGVSFETKSGSIVMAQASDLFRDCYKQAMEKGLEVWVLDSLGGKTSEIPALPFIPAMMQWFMRLTSLNDFNVSYSVESERYGFIPSIVGEFTKLQNFIPCDDGGIAIQKIAAKHFGPENVEKVMMAFKKATDGANYMIYNYADFEGPLQFGPAYPLINGKLYQYDFDNNDITLETDVNLKAADCFNKASLILSHIENDEAQQLSHILAFLVNTLVTCANAKRWYRRIDALEKTDTDYKKNFLYEQLLKIGEQEIKNAYETAEVLIKAPFLEGSNNELLSTPNALDTKIRMTEAAVNEIRNKINKKQ